MILQTYMVIGGVAAAGLGLWYLVSAKARGAVNALADGTADVIKAVGDGASAGVTAIQKGAQALGAANISLNDAMAGRPPGQFVEFPEPTTMEALKGYSAPVFAMKAGPAEWRVLDQWYRYRAENLAIAGKTGMDIYSDTYFLSIYAWRSWYATRGLVK